VLEGGKITPRQAIFILVISRLTIPLTALPDLSAPPANQDVWLAGLLAAVPTMVIITPPLLLVLRFPGHNLIQCSRLLLGRAGAVIGLLYVWFFLQVGATCLRLSGEYMTSVPMPETPLSAFLLFMAVIAASAVRNGLEVMARMADIIFPVIAGSIIMVVVLVSKEADVKALLPVMEEGLSPVLHGAFTTSSRLVEILALVMVLPHLNMAKPGVVWKIMLYTVAVFTAFFVIIILAVIAVLGPAQAQTYTFPFMSLTRLISLADIIERIEGTHLGIWLMGVFIKVSLYYYLAALGLSQLMGLKTYRPLVLPVGALLVVLSIWLFDSLPALYRIIQYQIWTPYALVFISGIPLFLLVVAMVTKKGVKQP